MNTPENMREEIGGVTQEQLATAVTSRVTITPISLTQLLQRQLPDMILCGLLSTSQGKANGNNIVAIATHRGAGLLTLRALISIVANNTPILNDEQLSRLISFGCRSNDNMTIFAALLMNIRAHRNYGNLSGDTLRATLVHQSTPSYEMFHLMLNHQRSSHGTPVPPPENNEAVVRVDTPHPSVNASPTTPDESDESSPEGRFTLRNFA
jgi:hypothetical protein